MNADPADRRSELHRSRRLGRGRCPASASTRGHTMAGLPGPLVRAHVGDRVIVHFTNTLPQPTTIHWHGVRVPIEMDGVPGISQPEVKTGRVLHLRLRGPRRRAVLVSPARDVGRAGRLRPLRRAARRRSRGRRRRRRSAHDGVERYRLRQAGRPRRRGQRRLGRHGVRTRGRVSARQRPRAAAAARPGRRAAAVAHRQCGEEPVLPARSWTASRS